MTDHAELPAYTRPENKERLLANGASGTVYALVMPESEDAFQIAMDGCEREDAYPEELGGIRENRVLTRYREPWTQKQDAMHIEYFDRWIEWTKPVLSFDADAYPFRYPTAGASEGIVKLMAEYLAQCQTNGMKPYIHVFEGEYEGFGAFARGLGIKVLTHRREDWRDLRHLDESGQFWVSQPSAIDGMVWEDFDAFCVMIDEHRQGIIDVVPDLSYVGAVPRQYNFSLDHKCIRAFVMSHSKPFGGYYHRCGGVFARNERPTLFSSRWFKNLLSLSWGVEMMKRHDVFDLPRRYRGIQEQATAIVGRRMGLELRAADVFVLASATPDAQADEVVRSLERGTGPDRCVRICVTPAMSALIDPKYAPGIADGILGETA